ERVSSVFRTEAHVGLVYGDGIFIDEAGAEIGPCPWTRAFDLHTLIHAGDFILQPSAFFRRDAFDAAGGLDSSLHYAMDWDLWIRLAGVSGVKYVPEAFAHARLWSGTKTLSGGLTRVVELARIAKRHSGRRLTPGVARELLRVAGNLLQRHSS